MNKWTVTELFGVGEYLSRNTDKFLDVLEDKVAGLCRKILKSIWTKTITDE